MDKKLLLTLLVSSIILFLLGIVFVGSKNKKETPNIDPNEIIYYYGNTCPHCKEVSDYIDKNDLMNKLPITKKEVYENTQNANEMIGAAKKCGLDSNNIGVPFVFSQEKCFIGTPDVIAYLKDRLNGKVDSSAVLE